jgi:hypothetical protein
MFDRLRGALRPTLPKIEVIEAAQPPAPMGAAPIQTEPLKTGVHYLIDEHTGQAYGEEHYNEHGKLDRGGDLPAVHIYPHDDLLLGAPFHHCGPGERKEWLSNGLHDRAGKPAIEDFGPDTYEARYLRKGVLHNDNGPAVAIDGRDSVVREWWKNGVLESRFEEFHGVEPDYEAPGGARAGIAYRQEVFAKDGTILFTASSSTDPFSWGERQERFERRPTMEERVSVAARLAEQKAYFDTIGGMSPYDKAPAFGHFPEGEVQDSQQDRAKPSDGLIPSAQPADGRVVSEQWLPNGQPIQFPKEDMEAFLGALDRYQDAHRPGGVKAAAAAAAAKQAQPEVIAKTGPKKARDDDELF